MLTTFKLHGRLTSKLSLKYKKKKFISKMFFERHRSCPSLTNILCIVDMQYMALS